VAVGVDDEAADGGEEEEFVAELVAKVLCVGGEGHEGLRKKRKCLEVDTRGRAGVWR
jgi:hypothetical protein